MQQRAFNSAVADTRMSESAIARARDVLVLGGTHDQVARKHGVSRACVTKNVRAVRRAFMRHYEAKAGQVAVTVLVPADKAKHIRALARRLREAI